MTKWEILIFGKYLTIGNYEYTMGITMSKNQLFNSKRDTEILPVRIKRDLLAQVNDKVARKKVSRNSWVIKTIKEGLRPHSKRRNPDNVE